ncbi:MAG: DMT family transporter [Roseobacter sp.]
MENLRGAALMVLAMLFFAIEDMIIKLLVGAIPIGQIVGMLGIFSALLIAPVLALKSEPLFSRQMLTVPILLRAIGEIVGTIGFLTAIALIPLSTASAILQATPLFVTLGAALFMQEQVGWRRWTAILVGFCGVLLIIRPGLEGFDWRSLFALQGVIGLGMRDLATRRVPKHTSTLQLSFWAFLALIPAAAIMMGVNGDVFVRPAAPDLMLLFAALFIGIGAYYAIVSAMRIGDVSFVSPFRYSRILFALVIGVSVFDERPDAMTLLGATVIVASGLYTLWREQTARKLVS